MYGQWSSCHNWRVDIGRKRQRLLPAEICYDCRRCSGLLDCGRISRSDFNPYRHGDFMKAVSAGFTSASSLQAAYLCEHTLGSSTLRPSLISLEDVGGKPAG